MSEIQAGVQEMRLAASKNADFDPALSHPSAQPSEMIATGARSERLPPPVPPRRTASRDYAETDEVSRPSQYERDRSWERTDLRQQTASDIPMKSMEDQRAGTQATDLRRGDETEQMRSIPREPEAKQLSGSAAAASVRQFSSESLPGARVTYVSRGGQRATSGWSNAPGMGRLGSGISQGIGGVQSLGTGITSGAGRVISGTGDTARNILPSFGRDERRADVSQPTGAQPIPPGETVVSATGETTRTGDTQPRSLSSGAQGIGSGISQGVSQGIGGVQSLGTGITSGAGRAISGTGNTARNILPSFGRDERRAEGSQQPVTDRTETKTAESQPRTFSSGAQGTGSGISQGVSQGIGGVQSLGTGVTSGTGRAISGTGDTARNILPSFGRDERRAEGSELSEAQPIQPGETVVSATDATTRTGDTEPRSLSSGAQGIGSGISQGVSQGIAGVQSLGTGITSGAGRAISGTGDTVRNILPSFGSEKKTEASMPEQVQTGESRTTSGTTASPGQGVTRMETLGTTATREGDMSGTGDTVRSFVTGRADTTASTEATGQTPATTGAQKAS